jgi:hypothetical protein
LRSGMPSAEAPTTKRGALIVWRREPQPPKLCGLGAAPRRRKGIAEVGGRASRDAMPFSNCGVAKRKGSGLISRQCAGSIPAPAITFHFWAARSFRRSPASQAGEHGAKPWRSTLSNRGKVENQGSLISFRIVVQLHVPEPLSCGGRSLKTRAGL